MKAIKRLRDSRSKSSVFCSFHFRLLTFGDFPDVVSQLPALEDVSLPDPDQNFLAFLEPKPSRALLLVPAPNALEAVASRELEIPDTVLKRNI